MLIIALMTVNVLTRHTLDDGSVWAQELEWHLTGVLILFGLSYAMLKDEHVRVDLFYANYPAAAKFLVDGITLLLKISICCVIIWLSQNYVEQSYSIAEIWSDPAGLPFR